VRDACQPPSCAAPECCTRRSRRPRRKLLADAFDNYLDGDTIEFASVYLGTAFRIARCGRSQLAASERQPESRQAPGAGAAVVQGQRVVSDHSADHDIGKGRCSRPSLRPDPRFRSLSEGVPACVRGEPQGTFPPLWGCPRVVARPGSGLRKIRYRTFGSHRVLGEGARNAVDSTYPIASMKRETV